MRPITETAATGHQSQDGQFTRHQHFIEVISLGPVLVKGFAEPVEAFELMGVGGSRSRFQAAARRGLTRFVGRSAVLEQLRDALDRASLGSGQVVAVVGELGVGKSRLFWELTHSHQLQGWPVLESTSVSYGKATGYLAVIDLLKRYFKIEDRDELREVSEKVTEKLLTLDSALEPTLPAQLASTIDHRAASRAGKPDA